MNACPAAWTLEESGPTIRFYLRRHTSVYTIEVVTQIDPALAHAAASSSSSALGDAGSSLSCVLWASVTPAKARQSADGEYNVQLPIVLAVLTVPCDRASSVLLVRPPQRWDVEAGSAVTLQFGSATMPFAATASDVAAAVPPWLTAVTFRLSGAASGPAFVPSMCEWRPLLLRRWFELRSHVREATILEPAHPDGDDSVTQEASGPLYQGDVRAARAVSANGSFVQWFDGSVGPMEELQPFTRRYTPADAGRTVRVRRHPHRHADVIGHVDYGLCVEAFGKTVDPFTAEHYVLLYLPHDEAHKFLIERYGLTATSRGRHIWGWTKVAGAPNGAVFLHEVLCDAPAALDAADSQLDHTAATLPCDLDGAEDVARFGVSTTGARSRTHGRRGTSKTEASVPPRNANVQRRPLTSPCYYMSVRTGKGVRIRAKPSLRARVVATLEANEVREAVALVEVSARRRTMSSPAHAEGGALVTRPDSVFVEWSDHTYSLMRDHARTFLAEVHLQTTIRRYPVRSRLSTAPEGQGSDAAASAEGGAACADSEVIDLDELARAQRRRARQKRGRDGSAGRHVPASRRAAGATSTTPGSRQRCEPEDDLLSPRQVPTSLQEGLRAGSVRLADLPLLPASDDEVHTPASSD